MGQEPVETQFIQPTPGSNELNEALAVHLHRVSIKLK
jgi:hypothetical protein